jgi:hypothetical protein
VVHLACAAPFAHVDGEAVVRRPTDQVERRLAVRDAAVGRATRRFEVGDSHRGGRESKAEGDGDDDSRHHRPILGKNGPYGMMPT